MRRAAVFALLAAAALGAGHAQAEGVALTFDDLPQLAPLERALNSRA